MLIRGLWILVFSPAVPVLAHLRNWRATTFMLFDGMIGLLIIGAKVVGSVMALTSGSALTAAIVLAIRDARQK